MLEKNTQAKYMLMYLGCVALDEGYFVVEKYTTEIHGHVSSLCTRWEQSDHKYTTEVHAHVPILCTFGKYTTKVHAHVSSLCTSGKYTTEVHAHVPSWCTDKKPPDQKYTTKIHGHVPSLYTLYDHFLSFTPRYTTEGHSHVPRLSTFQVQNSIFIFINYFSKLIYFIIFL